MDLFRLLPEGLACITDINKNEEFLVVERNFTRKFEHITGFQDAVVKISIKRQNFN